MSKLYCLTQCSMPMLNMLIGAGRAAGWAYQEAVGTSDLLVVGDMQGESTKMHRAERLGVKIVKAEDWLSKGFGSEVSS